MAHMYCVLFVVFCPTKIAKNEKFLDPNIEEDLLLEQATKINVTFNGVKIFEFMDFIKIENETWDQPTMYNGICKVFRFPGLHPVRSVLNFYIDKNDVQVSKKI